MHVNFLSFQRHEDLGLKFNISLSNLIGRPHLFISVLCYLVVEETILIECTFFKFFYTILINHFRSRENDLSENVSGDIWLEVGNVEMLELAYKHYKLL